MIQIGEAIGLTEGEVKKVLESEDYADVVRKDETEAQSLGISGVPFFVFNGKYAVSGAQDPEVFAGALQKSWSEFDQSSSIEVLDEGQSCSVDGNCD